MPKTVIAGRYMIEDLLGQAAFSRAVLCKDLKTEQYVCVKIITNNKDFFDQSIDEIKVHRSSLPPSGDERLHHSPT